MEREEILELLRDSLRIEVETESHYSGDMDGSGNLYRDSHTIKLILDGEVISSTSI
jgi:hypothetical protein